MAGPFPIRLSKFIAHAGITNRRKAGELVKNGLIKVNGKIAEKPGLRITEKDRVTYKGKRLTLIEEAQYLLINKSKSHLYSTEHLPNRKTLFDIIGTKVSGKLNTIGHFMDEDLGLIILSTDFSFKQEIERDEKRFDQHFKIKLKTKSEVPKSEEIMKKLMLPKTVQIKALYLSDDPLYHFNLSMVSPLAFTIREAFHQAGFPIEQLDRVNLAGMSKKNLSRGFFRHLMEAEVRRLRYFS